MSTMRIVIVLLALAGLVVSCLALRVHYSNDVEPCDINSRWDCGIVNHSPFAMIGPVPVAALGMAGYVLLGALAWMRRRTLLLAFSLVGLAFMLYLSHIEKDVLDGLVPLLRDLADSDPDFGVARRGLGVGRAAHGAAVVNRRFVLQFVKTWPYSRSKIPAAPMPPPTHMVTMP